MCLHLPPSHMDSLPLLCAIRATHHLQSCHSASHHHYPSEDHPIIDPSPLCTLIVNANVLGRHLNHPPHIDPLPLRTLIVRANVLSHQSSHSSSTGPSNQLLKCKWRDGKAPTGRPGARDYEPEVTSLILESIREYGALLVTNNPVPLPDEQITWATQCWKNVCERVS